MATVLDSIWQFIVLAFGIGTVVMTLTKSTVFRGFRGFVKSRSPFFGELVNCPYCMSHWISIFVVILVRPQFLHLANPIVDCAISGFALVAGASIVCGWIFQSIAPIPMPKDPPSAPPKA